MLFDADDVAHLDIVCPASGMSSFLSRALNYCADHLDSTASSDEAQGRAACSWVLVLAIPANVQWAVKPYIYTLGNVHGVNLTCDSVVV